MSDRIATLRARLAVLEPQRLEIVDDSHRHAGHAGAREGGHYRLHIVSRHFCGQSTLARHRLIYDAVGDLMRNGIHALIIVALSPEET
ncbi:MAG: BolA family transcriptional regulator [Azonexus sp.]|nr:BolA family protein [Azonexus sp.]MCK6412663.1 BolA family transcriptional regulator [Azonexus sp.]